MWFNSYAQLGPLLFAPGYALLSTPDAFDVAHVVSVIVFASTIFPVYLLTRMVTGDRIAALLGAIARRRGAVAEHDGFAHDGADRLPAVRLVRPRDDAGGRAAHSSRRTRSRSPRSAARPWRALSSWSWAPPIVAAVAIFALRAPDRRAELRAALRGHRLLLGVAGFGFVLLIVRPWTVLGAYAAPLAGDLAPPEMLADTRELLAYVAIGTGVLALPLAIAFIVLTLWRPTSQTATAFATVALTTGVLFALVSGSVNARYAGGDQRPLSLLSGASLRRRRRRAARGPAAGDGAASCRRRPRRGTVRELQISVRRDRRLSRRHRRSCPSSTDAPTSWVRPWASSRCARRPFSLWELQPQVSLLALMRRRLPVRALGLAVGVALVAIAVSQTLYDLRQVERTQAGVSQEFLDSRGWLDRVPGGDEPIGLLLGQIGDARTTAAIWWDTSFWSARADRVWAPPGTPGYEQGFVRPAEMDERTGRIPALDERRLIALSSSERRFGLYGAKPVGGRAGVQVVRVDPPVRTAWMLQTDTPSGFVSSGDPARLRVFADGEAGARKVAVVVVASTQAPARYRARLTGVGTPAPSGQGRPRPLRPLLRCPPPDIATSSSNHRPWACRRRTGAASWCRGVQVTRPSD